MEDEPRSRSFVATGGLDKLFGKTLGELEGERCAKKEVRRMRSSKVTILTSQNITNWRETDLLVRRGIVDSCDSRKF